MADSGSVYLALSDNRAYIHITENGEIKIKGTSLTFNGESINTSGNVTEGTEEAT